MIVKLISKFANAFGGFKNFIREVKVELMKCSWPTMPELRQSTIVVIISMFILGGFVGICDLVLQQIADFLIFPDSPQ